MDRAKPVHTPGAALVLLFTDIEGSTRRWEMYPGAMREALYRHDALLRSAISAAGGEIFKATGDGFCAVFATVSAATIAAWQAQTLIAAEDFAAVDGIRVRMAVHTGAADARDGDYFGPEVNRVARLLVAAHGGQVLLSGTAADMLEGTLPPSAGLLDLGEHTLKDLTRSERVFQLEAPGLQLEFPPLRSVRSPPHNLPEQTERLIGRDADRDSISALLVNHRLVTIVGAGGLGKTRMAIELGDSLLPLYPDGVWFVEFAPIQDATRLPEALLSVLSISLIPGTLAADTVVRFLREKKTLLIFDNCEHLVEGAASFVEMILQSARGVSVLATSRELLAVQGEAVFRLPTLEFPEKYIGMTSQMVAEFSAVKLFMQRARGLVLNDENAPVIAAICHQLDGIALAIELAAARTRMLQPVELLARLNDRFAILTGGSRNVLPRQQTLRAMIAWSYDLLTENEQCVMRRLSVFESSFSLTVAIDVCAFGEVEAGSVFGIFATLIDKSMISQILHRSGHESRYRLLETTKQYCLEQLHANQELAPTKSRLISAMNKFYREGEASWPVMNSASWRTIYEPDSENLRAALEAAFSIPSDPTSGVALVSSTSRFWYETASGTEAQRWLERAVTCISNATPPDVQAHIHLSIALSGLRGSQASALRAHKLFHEIGDDVYAPIAAAIAGRYLANPIDLKKAKPYFDEVAVALSRFGMTKHRAWLLDAMAAAAFCDGDPEETFRFAAESLQITKHYRDLLGVVFHGMGSSNETFFAIDVIGVTELGRELTENYTEPRDRFRLAWVLANLVGYHLKAGDFDAARAAGRHVIAMYSSLGCEFAVAMCADEMALLAAHKGDLATAARLSAFAWAYRQAHDFPHFKAKQSTLDQLHFLVDLRMPREARDICAAEGARWTADEAAAAALTA